MSTDKDDFQQVAEPTVRLCVLRTWPRHFDGYGFNLHAEKSKPAVGSGGGQYIGKVDIGSPAESAGLREGDRIVQVDGVDIEGKSHSTVVALIKKEHGNEAAADDDDDPDNAVSRTSLLVVDRRADTYYREKGIRVHSDMGLQVLVLRTPEEPTAECLSLQQNAKTSSSSPPPSAVVANVDSEPQASPDGLLIDRRCYYYYHRAISVHLLFGRTRRASFRRISTNSPRNRIFAKTVVFDNNGGNGKKFGRRWHRMSNQGLRSNRRHCRS